LMIGIASGAYSSIFIASPVLTEWKEREGSYRSRRARIVRELGAVPAYATALGGEPVDVEPTQQRRRNRRGSIIAPQEAGEQISRDEFQELVRDLDVDAEPKQQQKDRAAVAQRDSEQEQPEAQESAPEQARDPAADLTPEDLVLKEAPKRRERTKRPRNKRHGRSR
jgi:SecD/SecF fusion protein